MAQFATTIRNLVLGALLSWLGVEFGSDQKRDAEPPAPASQPDTPEKN